MIYTLSANDVSSLFFCPIKYDLQKSYSSQLPTDPRAFFYIQIHNVLKLFWKWDFEGPGTLSNYWRGYWNRAVKKEGGIENFQSPKAKEIIEESYPEGIRILRRFYKNNIWKKNNNRVAVFQNFEINLEDPEIRIKDKFHEIFWAGDEEFHVIKYSMEDKDLKLTEKYLHMDPIVLLMNIAFGKLPRGEVKFGKNVLRKGETVLTKIKPEHKDYFIGKFGEKIKMIKSGKYEPNFGDHCKDCDYFDVHYKFIEEDRPSLLEYREPKTDSLIIH
jgi:hypothetical protein